MGLVTVGLCSAGPRVRLLGVVVGGDHRAPPPQGDRVNLAYISVLKSILEYELDRVISPYCVPVPQVQNFTLNTL